MNEEYHVYEYEGPVLEFDQCVTDHWKGWLRMQEKLGVI